MIDTDKYEGHTTDWEWKDIGVSLAICSNGEAICFDTPDGNLAQDAPLLLEAYKRLRKALLLIADTANGRPFVSGHIGLPFVHEVFKELIE